MNKLYELIRNTNKRLAGKRHPKTNVLFQEKIVYSNGRWINIVFPLFQGYKINIGCTVDELWSEVNSLYPCLSQDKIDKRAYNLAISKSFEILRALYIQKNIYQDLVENGWKSYEITFLENGMIPQLRKTMTAHHLPQTDLNDNTIWMQFVHIYEHKNTGHSGGSQCWNPTKLKIIGEYDPSTGIPIFYP